MSRNGVPGTGDGFGKRAAERWRSVAFRALVSATTALLLLVALPGVSQAAVSVARAEVVADRLRIEGTALPNRTITVDGVSMGSSDGSGRFRIDRSGFRAPADCTVDVNDGSPTPATARLSGCTVSSPSTPALSSLSLAQTTVVGGTSVTGTVTLSAPAPTGGMQVALTSSDPAVASVPSSVTVAAGATSATFTVTTSAVIDSRSVTISGTAGGATRSATLTVVPQSVESRSSISLARGGTGHGRVTSQPPGVDCTFTSDSTSGACNNVFFPVGTQVRLEARAAANSRFLGWEFEVSCPDAPEVTMQAGVAHICRPAFALR